MNTLSTYFEGSVAKRLSAVEADPQSSNQHEFNGVKCLVELFGKVKPGKENAKRFKTHFIYLDDKEEDCEVLTDELTWYESRQEPRSEHRLYYKKSPVTEKFKEGDLVIFAKKTDGSVYMIFAASGSAAEMQLLWLFGLSKENLEKTEYADLQSRKNMLGFAEQFILEEIGIQAVEADENHLEEMLAKFGDTLPATKVFSAYARTKVADIFTDSDGLLMCWLGKEEELFRAFEKHIVAKTLVKGFGKNNDDVDEFIQFSLSVHNRRKARMGQSLENHLSEIFGSAGLTFSRCEITEQKKKPDFIFPRIEDYRSASFPTDKLTMLGAKSSCKDRWRQVISEANRIPRKHLLTLEPAITEDQTNEMEAENVQLVIPSPLQSSYTKKQQEWLMNLDEFIALCKERQS